jgi:pyruvate,orthophosphate dikinase
MDVEGRAVRIGDRKLVEGEFLSIDGNDGAVYPGRLTVVTERPERELAVIKTWKTAVKPDRSRHGSSGLASQSANQ